MKSHYDAIFKDILKNQESLLLEAVTGIERGEPQATDAGWYTGRSVDYVSKLNDAKYVHVEVQTDRNPTMHWRMLNYYTLLQHRFGRWARNDILIHQFVIYLGTGTFGLDGSHPLLGDRKMFAVVTLNAIKPTQQLARSRFHGDHVVRLLFEDVPPDDWLITFERFCSLHDESVRLDAMFYLIQLAGLRGMRETIENELKKSSMYDALMDTPLTKRAAEHVAKGEIIESLNRSLKRKNQGEFDSDELERLYDEQISLEDLRRVQDEVIDGANIRDSLKALSGGYKW